MRRQYLFSEGATRFFTVTKRQTFIAKGSVHLIGITLKGLGGRAVLQVAGNGLGVI
jgi:hypothetical protein